MVHVGVNAQHRAVVVQPAATIADVGESEHHVAGDLALVRRGPVLEPWQRQAIRRHADRGSAKVDGRVDQRRELDPILRESLVQVERWNQSIRHVRGERSSTRSPAWVDRQLSERDVRVVDAVSAPDRLLLVELVGKAHSGTQGILGNVLELPLPGASRAGSGKDDPRRECRQPPDSARSD